MLLIVGLVLSTTNEFELTMLSLVLPALSRIIPPCKVTDILPSPLGSVKTIVCTLLI